MAKIAKFTIQETIYTLWFFERTMIQFFLQWKSPLFISNRISVLRSFFLNFLLHHSLQCFIQNSVKIYTFQIQLTICLIAKQTKWRKKPIWISFVECFQILLNKAQNKAISIGIERIHIEIWRVQNQIILRLDDELYQQVLNC